MDLGAVLLQLQTVYLRHARPNRRWAPITSGKPEKSRTADERKFTQIRTLVADDETRRTWSSRSADRPSKKVLSADYADFVLSFDATGEKNKSFVPIRSP